MKRQGTNIHLCYYDSTSNTFKQFANSKSCEVQLKREMIEVASASSGEARDYIPGRYEWKMSIKCLLSDDNSVVENAFLNKTLLTVQWQDATSDSNSHETITGTAYIESFKATARIHDMASCQVELQGTGAVTIARS